MDETFLIQQSIDSARDDISAMSARKVEVQGKDFVKDSIAKIDAFLASPFLGSSMREHLEGVKKKLSEEGARVISEEIAKLDTDIQKRVTEKSVYEAKLTEVSRG